MMSEAEAGKPRFLSDDEARIWIGLDLGSSGPIRAGNSNTPAHLRMVLPTDGSFAHGKLPVSC